MRYRVEFRYREDTGEIELFQVDVVEGTSGRTADHNEQHDRVTSEIAGVLQPGAEIEEVEPARVLPVYDVLPPSPVTENVSRPNELPGQVN